MRRILKFSELFNSFYPWETEVETGTMASYDFDSPAGKYRVSFNISVLRSAEGELPSHDEIFSGIVKDSEYPITVAKLSFSLQGKQSITGTGEQFTVFSTVRMILRHFSRRYSHVNYLYFSAKESSRKKLYRAFSADLEKNVPEWEWVDMKDITFLGEETYIFIRK